MITHWIDDEACRRAFWGYVQELGLSPDQARQACGVANMRQYAGSLREACLAVHAARGHRIAPERLAVERAQAITILKRLQERSNGRHVE